MSVIRCAISSAPRKRRSSALGLQARSAGVAAFGVVAIEVDPTLAARQCYWICAIAFISLATTSLGSFAYDRASQEFCPSVTIHFRKSFTTSRFAVSVNFAGISSQVKLAIG